MKNSRFIDSKELKALLIAKRDNILTSEQNERLGLVAKHFANILIRTPKVRRFLAVNDRDGFLDLENQMRAQIAIVVLSECPYKYEECAGNAYSYCLYCAHSEICDVIRKHSKRLEVGNRIGMAYRKWGERCLPAVKASVSNPTDFMFAVGLA